jgi:hypothetical protein
MSPAPKRTTKRDGSGSTATGRTSARKPRPDRAPERKPRTARAPDSTRKKAPASGARTRDEPPRHPEKPLTSPEARAQLERARAICLALPGATEKIAWGSPTFRAPKVFAMFDDHHHGAQRIALWVPAEKGVQGALVGTEPDRFFRPPYVGPSGWIGIVLDKVDDGRLAALVEDAWRLVAPPRSVARRDCRSIEPRERKTRARRPAAPDPAARQRR